MKVLAGIVLIALCISSALCQTTSVASCIQTSLAGSSERLPSNCAETNTQIQTMIGGSVTDAALEMACNNECFRMLNDILVEDCGVSLINNILCARDSEGFCFSAASATRVSEQTTNLLTACFNTDCSSSACSSAVNSLSCCASTNLEFTQLFSGPSVSIDITPEGCSLPAACGGGMAVFATPAALLTALVAALAALF